MPFSPRSRRTAGLRRNPNLSLTRLAGAGAAIGLLAVSVVTACGGDEGAGPQASVEPRGTSVMTIATFTPVPPDFTPEALQTRSAIETAWAATQTAQPESPATAPPSVSVEQDPGRPTRAPNEIRPPDAILRTPSGDAFASLGSFNWYDVELQNGADVTAPYIDLPDDSATLVTGTGLQIVVPDSPFAVASAEFSVYTLEGNVAYPTDPQGGTTDELAFVPQTPPSWQGTVPGPTITLTPQLPPDSYIVSVKIIWEIPPDFFETPQDQTDAAFQLHTQYVYGLIVE